MKIPLIIISVLLISATLVSAEESHRIEFNQIGEKILVEHVISLEQEQKAEIIIPEDARAISSNVDYTSEENIIEAYGKNIEISYITSESLDRVNNKYYFVDEIEFNFDIEQVEIKLILDEGFVFEEGKSYPEPSATETDGRNIWLVWNLEDVKKGQDMPVFVVFRDTEEEVNTILISALIILIVLLSYLYLSRKKKPPIRTGKKRKAKKEEVIEQYLLRSEKAVINELKNAEKKELWQKQLQIKTGFSKAKLSRVIRNLEARNLIKKIPFGNTNKIKLR